MSAWTINLEDSDLCPWEGGAVSLYVDPEDRTISGHRDTGGTPEPVWHGRALLLAVPARAVASAVVDLLGALEDDLDDLQSCYRGATWSGSNHVGSWDEEWIQISERIELELEACPTYWEASDWFSGISRDEIARDVEEAGSVEAYARQQALSGGQVVVSEDDVAAYVVAELEGGA